MTTIAPGPASGRRRLGFVLLGLGLSGLVVGSIGWVTWEPPAAPTAADEAPSVAREVEPTVPPSTAPTSSAPTTTTPRTTPTAPPTTTGPEPESASDFVAALAAAMAATDVDTLTARLHPEVVARYGTDQCRAYVETQGDPSFELVLVAAGESSTWAYTTDGVSVDVADTFVATVDQTRAGETVRRDIHLAHFEGEIRWFSDCGVPVS